MKGTKSQSCLFKWQSFDVKREYGFGPEIEDAILDSASTRTPNRQVEVMPNIHTKKEDYPVRRGASKTSFCGDR
jgi:hypothetical protein